MLRLNGLTELNGAVLPRSESTMANAHRRYSCIVGMCGGDQRTSNCRNHLPGITKIQTEINLFSYFDQN